MAGGTKVMVGFVIGIVLALCGYFAFDHFVVDKCAATGGSWDWPTFTCHGGQIGP